MERPDHDELGMVRRGNQVRALAAGRSEIQGGEKPAVTPG